MGLRTPLFSEHTRLGARMISFGGWDMPLHYGSQIEEHHAVRRAAGLFDVSHMRAIDIAGPDAQSYLRILLANDVAKLTHPGKALYSCMLNPAGGVIDDLIVYNRGAQGYRAVVNAATTAKDLAWMQAQTAGRAVSIQARDDLAMLAVQGPEARARAHPLLPARLRDAAAALGSFQAVEDDTEAGWFVGRTGYTGEDGYEILLPAVHASVLWRGLLEAQVQPCGLGARDTLRLEAGLNLYGQDMDEEVGPLDAGLGWTLAWEPEERSFIGREALRARRDDPARHDFVGLLLTERGVLRAHQRVLIAGEPVGEVTSGGFSPTLERSIGLARVRPGTPATCSVEIRGKAVAARIVAPPFVRHGQVRIDQ
ncbi:glycine cleavage system protein T [Thiocapsa imhoffii]|uniref:Aminomethyltransferase n=1 Tax=Thiocapsa imhoffii TaxID=382777 RepID=A0A9X1B8L9_9GAMM|nr:glycine cleavage system aminomethyltransferase GcvT [Thiocapsa imhoffii]MBK1644210.1 glycine cleavage system protein T [Thiocapsa imhoffii]